jgi:hypothetical protein
MALYARGSSERSIARAQIIREAVAVGMHAHMEDKLIDRSHVVKIPFAGLKLPESRGETLDDFSLWPRSVGRITERLNSSRTNGTQPSATANATTAQPILMALRTARDGSSGHGK